MAKRKIHLRHASVIRIGHTKTRCGRSLSPRWDPAKRDYDTAGAVVTFNWKCREIDVTIHGTLVTCQHCLNRMPLTGEPDA